MPIVGKTPKKCFDAFADHIRPVIAGTFCPKCQVIVQTNGNAASALLGRGGRSRVVNEHFPFVVDVA